MFKSASLAIFEIMYPHILRPGTTICHDLDLAGDRDLGTMKQL